MKNNPDKQTLTFGDFIMSVFDACPGHKAAIIVWLAVNGGLVVSQEHESLVNG